MGNVICLESLDLLPYVGVLLEIDAAFRLREGRGIDSLVKDHLLECSTSVVEMNDKMPTMFPWLLSISHVLHKRVFRCPNARMQTQVTLTAVLSREYTS